MESGARTRDCGQGRTLSVQPVARFLHDISESWVPAAVPFETELMNVNDRTKNSASMLDGGPSVLGGIDRIRECRANRVSFSSAPSTSDHFTPRIVPVVSIKQPEART
jgi:hypothetical protein